MDKKKTKVFLQKMSRYYRFSIYNENHELKYSFQFPFSIFLIIISSLLFMVLFFLFFFIRKENSKKSHDVWIQNKIIKQSLTIDSLSRVVSIEKMFLDSIQRVLLEEVDVNFFEKNERNESIVTTPLNVKFIPRNKEDSILRNIVKRETKKNTIGQNYNKESFILFTPADNGSISEKYNPFIGHFGVDIALSKNSPIKSIADGTVIFSEWSMDTGYVIIIEHSSELLSIYKHNSSLTKNQGDFVYSGEIIAYSGNTGEFSTGWHLHFEIWHRGFPIDPEDIISF